jgi:hypothetical protein
MLVIAPFLRIMAASPQRLKSLPDRQSWRP